MASIKVQPQFVDVYIPFMQCLVESEITRKIDVYKFATQYFEEKVADKKERTQRDYRSNISKEGFSSSSVSQNFVPDFSYDSILEQFPTCLDNKELRGSRVLKKKVQKTTDKSAKGHHLLNLMLQLSKLLSEYTEVMENFVATSHEEIARLGYFDKLCDAIETDEADPQKKATDLDDQTSAAVPKTKPVEAKNQDRTCTCSRDETEFTRCPCGKRCKMFSVFDALFTSKQATLKYVRSVVTSAKCLMQLNDIGIEKYHRIGRLLQMKHEKAKEDKDAKDPMEAFHKLNQNVASLRSKRDKKSKSASAVLSELYENGNFRDVEVREEEPQIVVGKSISELIGNVLRDGSDVDQKKASESPPEDDISSEESSTTKIEPKVILKHQQGTDVAGDLTPPEYETNSRVSTEKVKFYSETALPGEDTDEDYNQFLSPSSSLGRMGQHLMKESCIDSVLSTSSNNSHYKDTLESTLQDSNRATGIDESSISWLKQFESDSTLGAKLDKIQPFDYETVPQADTQSFVYQLPENKKYLCACGNDKPLTDLDSTLLPMSGWNWLRAYFTIEMFREFDEADASEVVEIGNSKVALKLERCNDIYESKFDFKLQDVFGAIRTWYFSRKVREFQNESTS